MRSCKGFHRLLAFEKHAHKRTQICTRTHANIQQRYLNELTLYFVIMKQKKIYQRRTAWRIEKRELYLRSFVVAMDFITERVHYPPSRISLRRVFLRAQAVLRKTTKISFSLSSDRVKWNWGNMVFFSLDQDFVRCKLLSRRCKVDFDVSKDARHNNLLCPSTSRIRRNVRRGKETCFTSATFLHSSQFYVASFVPLARCIYFSFVSASPSNSVRAICSYVYSYLFEYIDVRWKQHPSSRVHMYKECSPLSIAYLRTYYNVDHGPPTIATIVRERNERWSHDVQCFPLSLGFYVALATRKCRV